MARPRIVRLDNGGEITLKNVPPEDADRITALILGKPLQKDIAPEEFSEVALSHSAIGVYQDSQGWHIAQLRYDPITRETQWESAVDVGTDRFYAEEKFKILVIKNQIL